mgnify:CR=1 FL=1
MVEYLELICRVENVAAPCLGHPSVPIAVS